MSTRSFTVLRGYEHTLDPFSYELHLYRHCDGYPAEAGADLARALMVAPDLETVAAALIGQRYDGHSGSRPTYRVCQGRAEGQGDLEHVYAVELLPHGVWQITHHSRGPSVGWGAQGEDYRQWGGAWLGTLPAFIAERVNPDRQAINRRLVELRRTAPDYRDVEGYPLLCAPGTAAALVTP